MTFEESALKLGVEIPEGTKGLESLTTELCTTTLIDSLQEKFNLFGEYDPLVKEALKEIQKDEAMTTWLNCAARYYQLADHDHARDLPVPITDGSLARDFLPLMVLLPSIELSYDLYRKRGFSHKEVLGFLKCIRLNLHIVETRSLGRPALTTTYFRWLAHYMKGTIFDHGGLNFELKKAAKTARYLKNKATGEIVFLCIREAIHRDGFPLGSAGFEDEDGSFEADFQETAEAFWGHPVINFRVQKEKEIYPKKEWDLFLSPGDDVISVHIPRKADLSPDSVKKAYREALEITKLRYRDYQPKAFICSSWLMDPTLTTLLGAGSRISQFAAPYHRCPNKSLGKEIFSFVFRPTDANNLSALSENTRLERALKAMYLQEKYIYAYTGMLPFDEI